MSMKSITFRTFLCGMSFVFAAMAEEERKTYELYQEVKSSEAGGTAFENAKWWRDMTGNIGTDGALPDATGDYYSLGYRIDTPNVSRKGIFFDCNSLHIGNEIKAGSLYVFVSMKGSSFGVGGEGLFLHRGIMGLQWYPITLTGRITAESPLSAPFVIQDAYAGTTNYLQSTLCAAEDKALWMYANNKVTQYSDSRQFVVDVTGDCSAFYGALKIGKDDDAERTTRLVLNGTTLPGSLSVANTGLLEFGSAASSVGALTLADGATLVMGKGTLAVSRVFEMAGRVTVSGVVTNFANVAVPTVDFLTLPTSSVCDLEKFDCAVTVSDPVRPATAALRVRENEDGTKTVYVEVVRKTVYVSPDGDDGNNGTQAMPYRTLAHAVGQCAGGVIHALPGTYAEGICDASETSTQSRIHLPKGTLLLSTGGAAVTTIVGARPTDGSDFGAGATRCARLDTESVLQGFTLTGGFVYEASDGDYADASGGGVLGCGGSAVLDCRITGNTAYRGGGCRGGAYVRCTFSANTATKGQWSGPDVFGYNYGAGAIGVTSLFDCLFTEDTAGYCPVYHSAFVYNSTFLGTTQGGVSMACKAINSLFKAAANMVGNSDYANCVFALQPPEVDGYTVRDCAVEDVSIDANVRPRSRRSAALDFGDTDAYIDAWDAAGIDRAYFGTDYAGGPRIVNGRIDAGCGEFNRPLVGGRVILR